MSPLHRASFFVLLALFVAMAVGLVVRGRWRACLFFDAYVAVTIVVLTLVAGWPFHFWRQWFVLTCQTVIDVLKFGIAVELAWRTFRPFQGARPFALAAGLPVLAITAVAASGIPISADAWEFEVIVGQLCPTVWAGTIWMMGATLLLARWFHVPVHPVHSSILTSFVCHLGLASVIGSLMPGGGGLVVSVSVDVVTVLGRANDLLIAAYWTFLSWRREEAAGNSHDLMIGKLRLGTSS